MNASPGRRGPGLAVIVGSLCFLAFLALLLYGVNQSGRGDRDALPSPLIGKLAPEFVLPLLHEPARLVTSKELLGAPYLLNVWGSWCPECRVEHPVMTRFALTKRVRVLGYNLKDEPGDALRWLEQFGNPYMLVLADRDGRAAIDWGIYGAPETFLVDAKGIVRWKHVGALDDTIINKEVVPLLEQLEAGK